MNHTSITMLEGLKQGDPARWQHFAEQYREFIRGQFARLCNGDDAEELTQDVLLAVSQGIGEFSRKRTGSFRAWLRTIARRRAAKFLEQKAADRAAMSRLAVLAEAVKQWSDDDSEASKRWNREHECYWAERLLHELGKRHSERDLAIYQERCQGIPAKELATRYGVAPQTIFVVDGRVRATMNALLEQWADLLEK